MFHSAITPDTTRPRLVARRWSDCAGPEMVARWDALVARAAEPNPFFEPWFLLPALKALDRPGRVRLLCLEQDGEWLGLLPLVAEPRYYRWPVPQWRSWVHANAFLGAPLIAAGAEERFWEALLGHLDERPGSGLFLHLTALPLDGPAAAALHHVADLQGRRVAVVHREERAMMRSGLDAEEYLAAALSGKKRKELRRQHARLAEQGELAVIRQDDSNDIDAWIVQFLSLEGAGWKGAAGSALASAPGTTALFTEALRGAAARGRLQRLALTLDGRPIAMLATFLSAPGAFSFKTAFDERFSRFSPGVLLQRENLALLADPRIEWCDSCAAADHPMIDHMWRERRSIGRLSVAIGGGLRRSMFSLLANAELARSGRAPQPGAGT